jgi:hypothetical protein
LLGDDKPHWRHFIVVVSVFVLVILKAAPIVSVLMATMSDIRQVIQNSPSAKLPILASN